MEAFSHCLKTWTLTPFYFIFLTFEFLWFSIQGGGKHFYCHIYLFLPFLFSQNENNFIGTSLVVQWLRLLAPNAQGLGSIPGQGTRSHMLQLRVHLLQLKDPVCCN